jgi:hypothetical protein
VKFGDFLNFMIFSALFSYNIRIQNMILPISLPFMPPYRGHTT